MNKQLLDAARAALDALSCDGGPGDPGHRCSHCDDYVDRNGTVRAQLRAAIEAAEKAEPLFLLHTGSMYGNERDEYEVEADSGERVDRFCDQHPGQTFPLYPHPPAQQPARQPMTDEEIKRLTGTPAAFQGTDIHAVIRAVERHHGIGEQEAGK